jgi:hypothetical protein
MCIETGSAVHCTTVLAARMPVPVLMLAPMSMSPLTGVMMLRDLTRFFIQFPTCLIETRLILGGLRDETFQPVCVLQCCLFCCAEFPEPCPHQALSFCFQGWYFKISNNMLMLQHTQASTCHRWAYMYPICVMFLHSGGSVPLRRLSPLHLPMQGAQKLRQTCRHLEPPVASGTCTTP